MAGHVVRAPDGRRWVVRRAWSGPPGSLSLHARVRRRLRAARERFGDVPDVDSGCLVNAADEAVIAVGVIALVVVLWFAVIPLLLLVVEVFLVVLLGVLSLTARVVLRRPWRVEAIADDGEVLHWDIVGWDASRTKVDEVAQSLASGVVPPPEPA